MCTHDCLTSENSWLPFHFLPQQQCALKTKYFTTLNLIQLHKTNATFGNQIVGPLNMSDSAVSLLSPAPQQQQLQSHGTGTTAIGFHLSGNQSWNIYMYQEK